MTASGLVQRGSKKTFVKGGPPPTGCASARVRRFMNSRNRFLHFLESLAIPNLALYIVLGQLIAFVAIASQQVSPDSFILVPRAVLAGAWWQPLAFIFLPPMGGVAWVALRWWIFYFFSNALESHWGTPRFNLFLLIGWALTVGLAFITPYSPASNVFIGGSVLLAFAYLAPNFELLLFFVLPVKVKWLALLAWCTYGYYFLTGGLATRLAVIAAVGNFFVFFSRDILASMRARQRRTTYHAQRVAEESVTHNRCRICGRDSNTNPELDFRYCSKCAGEQCYCSEHLANHEHVREAEAEKK